ncbi:glycoside hydrolase family 64 protein [Poronia punctata]|nr:glycoside hydrolase family 64 protein [Poronia punctata]
MRGMFGLAAATVAAFVTSSLARPLIVHPGSVDDVIITEDNTINGTTTHQANGDNPLQLDIVNNFGDNQMYLYVTGTDSNGAAVMLSPDGTFFTPDAGGSASPVPIDGPISTELGARGETTSVTLPDFLISARIWVSEGELQFMALARDGGGTTIVEPAVTNEDDPSINVKWGFVEFNYDDNTIYANISYVDWVGIAMGMGLTLATNETQIVKGLTEGAVENICNDLKAQAEQDGAGWDELCQYNEDGTALRALSSNLYLASHPEWQADYYNAYIDEVWAKYAEEDLTIATQSDAGDVACRVNGDDMTCEGDDMAFVKPTIIDIYGCNSGPFANLEGASDLHQAIVPRLCAAFTRSTLLLDGGNVQPSLAAENYYTVDPTNHYSRIVHNYEQDGLGYAFSYDDVNPDGENAAGTVAGDSPLLLKVTVGGWS